MALSLDDKLLGEKTHYYCSSSEDEDNEDEDSGDEGRSKPEPKATFIPEPQIEDYKGYSTNTGPKGVINDWRRFKQLETEKKGEQERERLELMKKLSLTCRTEAEDEIEKQNDAQLLHELEELEDGFLREYRLKRIEEMRKAFEKMPTFGKIIPLQKETFVDAIDKENPNVTIITHVYEDGNKACEAMNGSLMCLSQEYPTVKFCKLRASDSQLSSRFAKNGVPALLVYKEGELIGNFVGLGNEFGQDFFANDVEGFLVEHGLLPDKSVKVSTIRDSAATGDNSGDDSDFDID